jgi:hypothetical protein
MIIQAKARLLADQQTFNLKGLATIMNQLTPRTSSYAKMAGLEDVNKMLKSGDVDRAKLIALKKKVELVEQGLIGGLSDVVSVLKRISKSF